MTYDQRDSAAQPDANQVAGRPAGPAALPDESPAPPDESPAAGKRRGSWRQLMVIVLAAIILMLLVKAFVVQVYRIPSASMEDTLLTGDRVLVNKLAYHFRGIDRGDIVVFSGRGSWGSITGTPDPALPGNPFLRFMDGALADAGIRSTQTYYIKRVIGLPGDRVACCTSGMMTVNGIPLHERSYLFPGASPSQLTFSVTVPPGRLWVMGDNRAISDDSRGHMTIAPENGTVPENQVVGRAFLIIWPPSQLGDLPIPPAFQQAAMHPEAAGAALLGVPLLGVPLLGVPLLAAAGLRARGRRRGCAGARR